MAKKRRKVQAKQPPASLCKFRIIYLQIQRTDPYPHGFSTAVNPGKVRKVRLRHDRHYAMPHCGHKYNLFDFVYWYGVLLQSLWHTCAHEREGRTEKGSAIHDYKVCFGEEREWIQSANSIAELRTQYTGRAQASPSLCMV